MIFKRILHQEQEANPPIFLLVGIVGLLLVGLMVFLVMLQKSLPSREVSENPSVLNMKSSGYKAWKTVMEQSDTPITLWKKPISNLKQFSKEPVVMVMIRPGRKWLDHRGMDDLLSWVKQGNTLIFLDGFWFSPSKTLLKTLDLDVEREDISKELKTGEKPKNTERSLRVEANKSDFFLDAEESIERYTSKPLITRTRRWLKLLKSDRDIEVLLRRKNKHKQPVLIKTSYGKGEIVLGTVHDIAGNRYLYRDVDNYQVFTNVLTSPQKPILMNEYVHGYSDDIGIMGRYLMSPLGNMFVQLGLLMMVILWGSFVRWKPVKRLQIDAAGVNMREFIRSLSGIYYKTRASSLVIAPLLQDILDRLSRRYRIDVHDERQLQRILGDKAIGLKRAQEIVDQELRLSHQELLTLMQKLSQIQDKLIPRTGKIVKHK